MSTGEPVGEQESSSSQSSSAEQVDELRAVLTTKVAALLEVDEEKARKIVEAFDAQIARPVESRFAELQPHDLLKRNPYFYGVLGVTSVEDWIDRALADLETSALESHVGRWLEDVARIMSGGIKPGSGVDVQREIGDDVVELYSLQMAANTKSSGGSQAEINNLRQAAAPLRTHGGKRVTTIVGVMYGRKSSRPSGADPNILKPSSEEALGAAHRPEGLSSSPAGGSAIAVCAGRCTGTRRSRTSQDRGRATVRGHGRHPRPRKAHRATSAPAPPQELEREVRVGVVFCHT
jgi:hypothetical protein